MSGRTSAAAIAAYQEPLRRAVSCVTRQVPINRGHHYRNPELQTFALGADNPVRLAGADRLNLRLAQHYRVLEDNRRWRVVTLGYMFSMYDANHQEIIAFHWHPDGRSPVTHPHLHIGAGARAGYERLQKAHLPTGHITIHDVLRFAIADLGVEPIIDRDEALRVLSQES